MPGRNTGAFAADLLLLQQMQEAWQSALPDSILPLRRAVYSGETITPRWKIILRHECGSKQVFKKSRIRAHLIF